MINSTVWNAIHVHRDGEAGEWIYDVVKIVCSVFVNSACKIFGVCICQESIGARSEAGKQTCGQASERLSAKSLFD